MLLALLAGCGEDKVDFPDAPEQRPNPLLILGIDGASWRVMEPMMARGELPHFARLRERGVWGELIAVVPTISPVVWTSFATGRFGRAHGILDFVYPYTAGEKRPVRSTDRLVPAIWNIASAAGLRVGMVGYYASYPAEPVNGINISDRAFRPQPGSVWPADALKDFESHMAYLHSAEGQAEVWRRFFPWPYKYSQSATPATQQADTWVDGPLDENLVYSEFLRRVSLDLLEGEKRFDLFISYFRPVDIASHALWYFYDDNDFSTSADPKVKALLGDIIPETYRYMDLVLGQLLERMPDETNVMVISDHGFGSATGRYAVPEDKQDELTGNHRPDGIFIAAGPDIQTGHVTGLTTMEIMPIAMALLGLPIASDLPGNVDYRVLNESLYQQTPLKTVASYKDYREIRNLTVSDSSSDTAVVEELQGLGYVGADFKLGNRDLQRPFNFWQLDDRRIVRHLGEEILYYLLMADIPAALGVLAELNQHRSGLVGGVTRHSISLYRNIQKLVPAADIPNATTRRFRKQAKAEFLN